MGMVCGGLGIDSRVFDAIRSDHLITLDASAAQLFPVSSRSGLVLKNCINIPWSPMCLSIKDDGEGRRSFGPDGRLNDRAKFFLKRGVIFKM